MRRNAGRNEYSDYSGRRSVGSVCATMALPSYRGIEFEYVVGDQFGGTVVWIRKAFVYSFHGEVSLSFLFSSTRYKERYTARVLDRSSAFDPAGDIVFLYHVRMLVEIDGNSHVLDMRLCESAAADAPAIVSHRDLFLFSSLHRD
jgi:hypothetical protein